MNVLDLEQGSPEWLQARCGSLGASRIADALARTKSGWGASRGNLLTELVCERLTGTPTECFVSDAMRHGTEQEPHARAMYEFLHDAEVKQVGLVLHPTIKGTHASPDGLVGEHGLIEIKAPSSRVHIETLMGAPINDRYIKQMQWQMAVCERAWCDFVSFDPRLPAEMQLFVKRVPRDDELIAELEREVAAFLEEVDETVASLRQTYQHSEAA